MSEKHNFFGIYFGLNNSECDSKDTPYLVEIKAKDKEDAIKVLQEHVNDYSDEHFGEDSEEKYIITNYTIEYSFCIDWSKSFIMNQSSCWPNI